MSLLLSLHQKQARYRMVWYGIVWNGKATTHAKFLLSSYCWHVVFFSNPWKSKQWKVMQKVGLLTPKNMQHEKLQLLRASIINYLMLLFRRSYVTWRNGMHCGEHNRTLFLSCVLEFYGAKLVDSLTSFLVMISQSWTYNCKIIAECS